MCSWPCWATFEKALDELQKFFLGKQGEKSVIESFPFAKRVPEEPDSLLGKNGITSFNAWRYCDLSDILQRLVLAGSGSEFRKVRDNERALGTHTDRLPPRLEMPGMRSTALIASHDHFGRLPMFWT